MSTPTDLATSSARQLPDTKPQTAEGKVLWHFTMSLDGFAPNIRWTG